MVKKIKKTKKVEIKKKIGILYRNIAFSFTGATVFLVLLVLFFSLIKAQITLILNQEDIATEFTTSINLDDLEKNTSGFLLETLIKDEKSFPVSQGEIKETKATGEVIIINNYSKTQPLVATTRLVSPEGIFFHLFNTVRVSPGNRVKAKVYADKPGEQGEIGPTKFTIPGLWPGLQDKIYAISEEPMTGGTKKVGQVTQEDIDRAKEKLKEELRQKGLAELEKKLSQNIEKFQLKREDYKINPNLTIEEIIIEDTQAKVGEEKEEFVIAMEIKLTAMSLNEEDLFNLAQEKLKQSIPENKKLISIEREKLNYSLEKFAPETKTADIKISLTGKIMLELSDSIFQKDKLLGINELEIKNYFSQFNKEIKEIKIKFFPSFLKITPFTKNQLKIKIIE